MMATRRRRAPARGLMVAGALISGSVGALWPVPALAQDAEMPDAGIAGRWNGSVALPGATLDFSVSFEDAGGELSALLDIPGQGAHDVPLSAVSYEDGMVHFELEAPIGLAVWEGERDGNSVEGRFTQGAVEADFTMTLEVDDGGDSEPPEQLPYEEEEVAFENGEIHLEGTLTIPEGAGPFPAVVMITGSGPQNRDEELLGFPVFRVIVDHLTRNGIATLRYDDRGVGGSTGNVSKSTTEDFATDVLAAVEVLVAHPAVDPDRIGLVGHSEGGVVAPLAATRSERVAFAVLMAGTSVTGAEIIYEQSAAIARAAGAAEGDIEWTTAFQRRLFAAIEADEELDPLRRELHEMIKAQTEALPEDQRAAIVDIDAYVQTQVSAQVDRVLTPWFRYFLSYDPAVALKEMDQPVLALFGDLDLQVLPSQNVDPMAESLQDHPDATIEVIPGANHLFQAATTGSPAEYGTLEPEFIEGFLDKISDWILERFGN